MGTQSNDVSGETITALSFSDFPEDVQLCILSFLDPSELSGFASTSKRYLSLCRHDDRLWFSMCHRRWGPHTQIDRWGSGKDISYRRLYSILNGLDSLIGFWRRCGQSSNGHDDGSATSPLLFFEWGQFYLVGSRVSPSKNGSYGVVKTPFLWMGVNKKGEEVNYLDFEGSSGWGEDLLMTGEEEGRLESQLIRVDVNFMGKCHVVVEENSGFSSSSVFRREPSLENIENAYGSPPDRLMSEIYQHFANRMSPGGSGMSRRQRRREKEKQEKMRKWEPEHFVKIVNCLPTPARPLQGLWKGLCDDMSLDFYLVSYDDIGGIACRKVGDISRPCSYHAPVFWTSSTTFLDFPFSVEEDHIYNSRSHLQPATGSEQSHENGSVSRILYINSSYDLVIPDLAGTITNPRQVEGRIWQYGNGTFGFGFLRDNHIIDLKHIAKNGHLLDMIK